MYRRVSLGVDPGRSWRTLWAEPGVCRRMYSEMSGVMCLSRY